MCMNSPYGPGAIAFEFAQVGKDQAAQAFLGQLDKDPGNPLHMHPNYIQHQSCMPVWSMHSTVLLMDTLHDCAFCFA